jgi:hypothetical protein
VRESIVFAGWSIQLSRLKPGDEFNHEICQFKFSGSLGWGNSVVVEPAPAAIRVHIASTRGYPCRVRRAGARVRATRYAWSQVLSFRGPTSGLCMIVGVRAQLHEQLVAICTSMMLIPTVLHPTLLNRIAQQSLITCVSLRGNAYKCARRTHGLSFYIR